MCIYFISVPPKFEKHDYKEKIVLKSGASAVLELPFSSSPQPEVTWAFKGGRLPDARRFKHDTIRKMTSLSMAKVVKSDAGEYSVVLENKYGKASFSIKLVVLGECDQQTGRNYAL